MNTTTLTTRPFRTLLNLLLLVLTLSLTACVDNMAGPDIGDPDTGGTPEEPRFKTVYDLKLTTRYIEVGGSCDIDIRGPYANGEFQYRYKIKGEGKTYQRESKNYDSRFGEFFVRQPEEIINFTNKTYSWTSLSETAEINVEISGVEWDGAIKDPRMKNRSNDHTVPFHLGKKTRSVGVGADRDCVIALFYDAEWTERRVQP